MSETLEQIALRVAKELDPTIIGNEDPGQLFEFARRLVAALGAQSAVGELPEGRKIYSAPVVNPDWHMVPKELTPEMKSAWAKHWSLEGGWKAMLAAASKEEA